MAFLASGFLQGNLFLGLNECGIVTLSYPKEKKNSVSGGIKHIDLPDDHIMPVGLPNMYSQVNLNPRPSIFLLFSCPSRSFLDS